MSTQRKTPLMGWASWNCFRTDISEEKIRDQADMLVKTGLAECGYTFVNIDDGFLGGRDKNGNLLFHAKRFPNGLRPVADAIHKLGLSAGIYTDAGDNTCAYYYDNEVEGGFHAGCYQHEEADLRLQLIDNDFDFIKVDFCGGLRLHLDEEEQYTKIARIIEEIRKETGKSIVYNICRWEFPGEWAVTLADSWRIGVDIEPDFASVLYQIDKMKAHARFCTPGHCNDADMMQLGTGMSEEEDKTHFAMWCMLTTPLMIGGDLHKISPRVLSILKNKDLIAINQDELCMQAVVTKEFRAADGCLTQEIWTKELSSAEGAKTAIAVLNRCAEEADVLLNLHEAGCGGEILQLREVCLGEELAPSASVAVHLPGHGIRIYVAESSERGTYSDVNAHLKAGSHRYEKLSEAAMQAAAAAGATLVDVRTAEEYATSHLPGAINMPYSEVYLYADELLPDKNQPIIATCRTGKRCTMVKGKLDEMGYKNVSIYY